MFRATASIAAVALLAGGTLADDLKSGPAVGQSVGAFLPLNVTGPDAGKAACLVCSNGSSPVVAIFARGLDADLAALVKKVDAATLKNKKAELASFVVVLDKAEKTERAVQDFADTNAIQATILALDNPAGPKGYNLAKDAHITVLLYVGRKVKANFAFEKGKLTAADIDNILKALPKILEE